MQFQHPSILVVRSLVENNHLALESSLLENNHLESARLASARLALESARLASAQLALERAQLALERAHLLQPNTSGKKLLKKSGRKVDKPLLEIRQWQKADTGFLPRAPLRRLIKEIADVICPEGIRFQSAAIPILQEAVVDYVSQKLSAANLFAIHAGRVTLMAKDFDGQQGYEKKHHAEQPL